jgi:hypothetical protein
MDLKNNNITIGEILKNVEAKRLLEKEFPQYIKQPMLSMAMNMPLSRIISMSQGKVPQDKINSLIILLQRL